MLEFDRYRGARWLFTRANAPAIVFLVLYGQIPLVSGSPLACRGPSDAISPALSRLARGVSDTSQSRNAVLRARALEEAPSREPPSSHRPHVLREDCSFTAVVVNPRSLIAAVWQSAAWMLPV